MKRTKKKVFNIEEAYRETFDRLAANGCIGAANGVPAFAYIRVSSQGQAEDGGSGLPRQIEAIHEIAAQRGYTVAWNMVFADDASGFEFEHRPALTRLRREYTTAARRATTVIIEELDRLSRNAEWHQGFLLDEMKKYGVATVFWKPLGSRIERSVQGAVAQEGMEGSKLRMKKGSRDKAMSARITAKTPAFGYRIVDSRGQPGYDARKDSHYAIDDCRADVVRFIFTEVCSGTPIYKLCTLLDQRSDLDPAYAPPRAETWGQRQIAKMIRSTVYKGVFIANRSYKEKVTTFDANGNRREYLKDCQRPESEWITIPAPAIVNAEQWEQANRNIAANKRTASRSAKTEYLLTGLVHCAVCGYAYRGCLPSRPAEQQRYYCSHMFQTPKKRSSMACDNTSVTVPIMDNAVWNAVAELLFDPGVLSRALDERYNTVEAQDVRKQIEYLESTAAQKDIEDERLKRAYLAGAFTAEEFAEERTHIKKKQSKMNLEITRLRSLIMPPEQVAERKQRVLTAIHAARGTGDPTAIPFATKKRTLKLLVDDIVLDARAGQFEIKGVIGAGFYGLSSTVDRTLEARNI